MKNPGTDGEQLPMALILESKPYPGTHATIGQFIALADEYCVAAYSLLSQCNRMSPSSSAPARLCAIHAVEMYLNAFLIFHGMTPGTEIGTGVAERMLMPKAEKERLRSKIAAEVRNPENKVERRWLGRAAVLAALGLLVMFSPLVFNP